MIATDLCSLPQVDVVDAETVAMVMRVAVCDRGDWVVWHAAAIMEKVNRK